ncbi:hypothetical protein [Vibrio phage phiKT1019]|nr:hypothetical protein [Vibrio phage phiKT1019]
MKVENFVLDVAKTKLAIRPLVVHWLNQVQNCIDLLKEKDKVVIGKVKLNDETVSVSIESVLNSEDEYRIVGTNLPFLIQDFSVILYKSFPLDACSHVGVSSILNAPTGLGLQALYSLLDDKLTTSQIGLSMCTSAPNLMLVGYEGAGAGFDFNLNKIETDLEDGYHFAEDLVEKRRSVIKAIAKGLSGKLPKIIEEQMLICPIRYGDDRFKPVVIANLSASLEEHFRVVLDYDGRFFKLIVGLPGLPVQSFTIPQFPAIREEFLLELNEWIQGTLSLSSKDFINIRQFAKGEQSTPFGVIRKIANEDSFEIMLKESVSIVTSPIFLIKA